MDDFEQKLNQVLSDPESMQKIFSIAQSLGAGMPATSETKEEVPAADTSLLPDLSMLSTIGKLMQSQGQNFSTPCVHFCVRSGSRVWTAHCAWQNSRIWQDSP